MHKSLTGQTQSPGHIGSPGTALSACRPRQHFRRIRRLTRTDFGVPVNAQSRALRDGYSSQNLSIGIGLQAVHRTAVVGSGRALGPPAGRPSEGPVRPEWTALTGSLPLTSLSYNTSNGENRIEAIEVERSVGRMTGMLGLRKEYGRWRRWAGPRRGKLWCPKKGVNRSGPR